MINECQSCIIEMHKIPTQEKVTMNSIILQDQDLESWRLKPGEQCLTWDKSKENNQENSFNNPAYEGWETCEELTQKKTQDKELSKEKIQVNAVSFKKTDATVVAPKQEHQDDVGTDIAANEDADIGPQETRMMPTGISVEIPKGYYRQMYT